MLAFQVLPRLAREAQSESLAHAFEEHLEQTRAHASRVEEAFRAVSGESSSSLDPAAQRLFEHHDAIAETIVEPLLRDVFHAASAAKVEHHELAGYETLIALGRQLGVDVGPLERNRDEDAAALEQVEAAGARLSAEIT